jgi:hypothetical protein
METNTNKCRKNYAKEILLLVMSCLLREKNIDVIIFGNCCKHLKAENKDIRGFREDTIGPQ